jgi:F0F1-type ATP synthase alpha subunit
MLVQGKAVLETLRTTKELDEKTEANLKDLLTKFKQSYK